MKLTVLGGGGVRSPLLVAAALHRPGRIHLDEIALMDTNPEKLAKIGSICQQFARIAGSAVKVTTTNDARAAIDGAGYIITTIRVGEEQGRVWDERIALKHGVLGQETTGPGGFAMAMRSIPVILEYARLAKELAPRAWIFNFTNPAGLVTQALHALGYTRSVGICDGANQAQRETAKWLGVCPEALSAEVFGLNHLSWTRALYREGEDILASLLQNPEFLQATCQKMFAKGLLDDLGMWLNEYLYYYYYADRALKGIQNDTRTRGEEVLQLNRLLLDQLEDINIEQNPEKAIHTYLAYERRRSSTYMHYAYSSASPAQVEEPVPSETLSFSSDDSEGYAGVALGIIEAFEGGAPLHTALNIPNHGAIDCMRPDDIVEVSCVVEEGRIHPIEIGVIPEHQELLMRSVKVYERRAVKAILHRSISEAEMALMSHPLVLSYPLAQELVAEYLQAHAPFVGKWI